jgi:hypothetical protein
MVTWLWVSHSILRHIRAVRMCRGRDCSLHGNQEVEQSSNKKGLGQDIAPMHTVAIAYFL